MSVTAMVSSNGLTNTWWCRCSCMRSWWWVVVPPETCRAVYGESAIREKPDIYKLGWNRKLWWWWISQPLT